MSTHPAPRIRRATLDDLDDIMVIESATFPADAWSRGQMRGELASPHGYYLTVHDGAELIAYCGLRAPRGVEQADVQTIAVADSARRRGLGRALMRAMIAEARDRGASELFLEVRADNPGAQALYAELGFEQIAVRPQYYQPDGVDALILRLEIPAARLAPAGGAA